MNIVVCIKQVPDTTQVRINPKTNTLIRQGIPTIVNPYDLHAVEEAVRIKEQTGGKVTAVSMGPPQAAEALREAVSAGCDHGVLLTDRAFAGSDTLATSYIIAAAVKRLQQREKVDIVVCGQQSIDGDTAQVGPGVAQRLDFTQLTYVSKIRNIDLKAKKIIVERRLEKGVQVLAARLPALLTVVKEINEFRYASLANLIKAAKFAPEIWSQSELKLDPGSIGLKGSPTAVKKIFAPPRRGVGVIMKVDGAGAAEISGKVAAELRKKKII